MQKFRSHKSRLIHSKRDSQKIDQLDLITLGVQQHYNNSCFNVTGLIKKRLHGITQENYKIREWSEEGEGNGLSVLAEGKMAQIREEQLAQTEEPNHHFYSNETFKTDNTSPSPTSEPHLLDNILSLTKSNLQPKSTPPSFTNETIKKEIKSKLTEFKQLMGQFQNSYQTNMLNFYNEDNPSEESHTSFNSRSSQESSLENTDRVAYQMEERQNFDRTNQIQSQNQFERKCHRVTESTQSFDTFSEDAQKDQFSPQIQLFLSTAEQKQDTLEQKQDKQLNESSIIHLFSYQKQKTLQSPLPSITQRSSEYHSPETKQPANQLFTQSLQYKKIFYLLQTTEKKKNTANTSNKHEVPELQLSNSTNGSDSKDSNPYESNERNKSHSQLKCMINLLQTKYKRSVKKDTENKNKPKQNRPKYPVLNSNGFKQRLQR